MPPRAKSAHFAIHHLGDRPSRAERSVAKAPERKLSTGDVPTASVTVDESPRPVLEAGSRWLGTVVPKRHARRSVTRNLLKRQMRAAVAGGGERLLPGLWVIRLRSPFDIKAFASAASTALRTAARDELGLLVERAAVPRG